MNCPPALRMRLFCLCIAISMTMIVTGCSQSTKNRAMFDTTPALSKIGDTAEDESSLSQKTPEQLIAGGFVYLATDNPTLAKMHFISALKRDPQAAMAYVGLGRTDYAMENYAAALANFQRANAIEPDNLEALLGQARTYRQAGKLSMTSDLLNQALKIAPNDVRVLNELAINYDLQGQEKLALPLYQEIAALAPEQASPFNNVGVGKLAQKDYEAAAISFSQALARDDNDPRIRNNLAMTLALQGKENQAIRLFTETVGAPAAWNNLGYLYMTQGRYDDAERALRKALELHPKFYPRAQENLDRLQQLRADAGKK